MMVAKAGKPIIGIAQSGSDLSPCNRPHLELAARIREGIREAGGIVSALDGAENLAVRVALAGAEVARAHLTPAHRRDGI